MKEYDLTEAAEQQYRGCGYALAATENNKVIAIAYLDDLSPAFANSNGSLESASAALTEPSVIDKRNEMRANGSVHFGMLSGRVFVEM